MSNESESGALPDTVKDLIRVIGEHEAVKLMNAYPKMNLCIPRSPDRAEVLKKVLSTQAIELLCQYYDGETIYIPSAESLQRVHRDRAIQAAHGKKSLSKLAREYGLSTRRVRMIQSKAKPG